jgi:hypothetical protein
MSSNNFLEWWRCPEESEQDYYDELPTEQNYLMDYHKTQKCG